MAPKHLLSTPALFTSEQLAVVARPKPLAVAVLSDMPTNLAICEAVELVKGERSPKRQLLIPAGTFRARDGRPHDTEHWLMDSVAASVVIANADARQTQFVVDYEHQTIKAAENGEPAPAAAWFKKLVWVEGEGLYTEDLLWTERAAQMVEKGEYRYFSPVFEYETLTGRPLKLYMVGLTNTPALDNLPAVALKQISPLTGEPMKNKLLPLLALAATATEEQILAGVVALKEQVTELTGKLQAQVDAATALSTEVVALKEKTPDAAKFVPIEVVNGLMGELAVLKTKTIDGDVIALVDGALADGRLTPSLKSWALDLGKANLVALKEFVAKQQPIAGIASMQTEGKETPGKVTTVAALTEDQKDIIRRMGISEADYQKQQALNGGK